MVKEKGMQFFIINMKMKRKRKRDKKIDLAQRGFEPRIFQKIPAQNLREIRFIKPGVLRTSGLY